MYIWRGQHQQPEVTLPLIQANVLLTTAQLHRAPAEWREVEKGGVHCKEKWAEIVHWKKKRSRCLLSTWDQRWTWETKNKQHLRRLLPKITYVRVSVFRQQSTVLCKHRRAEWKGQGSRGETVWRSCGEPHYTQQEPYTASSLPAELGTTTAYYHTLAHHGTRCCKHRQADLPTVQYQSSKLLKWQKMLSAGIIFIDSFIKWKFFIHVQSSRVTNLQLSDARMNVFSYNILLIYSVKHKSTTFCTCMNTKNV